MLEKAQRFIEEKWWGILPAYAILLLGSYLAVWQLAEPIGMPESITELPPFTQSRIFFHLVLTVLISSHVTLALFSIMRWKAWKSQGTSHENKESKFLIGTYPRSQDPQFFLEVERLIPVTKKIVLISSGLNLIWNKHILDALIQRAKSDDVEVTICIGNPYSPHIQSRWIEEMQHIRPQFGREAMAENLGMLLRQINAVGQRKNMSVLLFEHYPTFSTLIFDNNIFVYPYAYELLGNFSPIFRLWNNDGPEARFFIDNAQRILAKAIPAQDVINAHLNRRYKSREWISLAVMVIPEPNSTLYDFGSRFLGYDVRFEKLRPADTSEIEMLRKYVGESQEFGFQAPLVEPLYFASEKAIDRIRAEVRALCEDFKPFVLSDFNVVDTSREGNALVVACKDETGVSEALHCECVQRINKCAISSAYLTGITHSKLPAQQLARAELMMHRYGSPYVLKQFELHFTLCSTLPSEEAPRTKVKQIVENLLHSAVKERELEINEICLVVKRPQDTYWHILESFPLIGK